MRGTDTLKDARKTYRAKKTRFTDMNGNKIRVNQFTEKAVEYLKEENFMR